MGNAHFLVWQLVTNSFVSVSYGNAVFFAVQYSPKKLRIPLKTDEKIRTLSRLIALIQALQERFKSRISTNHLKSALYSQRVLKGETITVGGFVTICATCKKVKNELERWLTVEQYIEQRIDIQFSHGLCPTCHDEALLELEE